MTMPRPAPGDMLEIALALWEQDFPVIPLGDPFSPVPASLVVEHDGDVDKARYAFCKKARIPWRDYQGRMPSEDDIRGWWHRWPFANPGIITGVNVVVVDGDTPEACAFLESGVITMTPWKVHTARGAHYYFRANASLILRNSAANGLDVRGVGGYVVAAGAISGDYRPYTWEINEAFGAHDVSDLPMLTADDVARIYAWRGISQPSDEVGEATGEVLANLGVIQLPHDGKPAEVGSRNTKMTSMVGQWFASGMSMESVMFKARALNLTFRPPLSDAEVMRVIASVAASHRRNHGAEIPAEDPPVEGRLRLFTLGDLEDTPPPEPEYFWRGAMLFRGSRTLIAGEPKLGKSAFVVALGMAAATGGQFLGYRFERPLKFVWLQAEIHEAFVSKRVLMAAQDLTPEQRVLARENFLTSGRCDIDLLNDRDDHDVRALLDQVRPDIVCLDPVINFSSAKENDNTEVRAMLRRVDHIGEKFQCATILLHHVGKSREAKTFHDIRGASAFRGWYDTGIMLSGDPSAMVCAYEMRNAEGVAAHGLHFDPATGHFEITDLAESSAVECTDRPSLSRQDVARNQREPKTNHDTTNLTETDNERIWQLVNRLKDSPNGIGYAEIVDYCMKTYGIKDRKAKQLINGLNDIHGITKERKGFNTVIYRVPADRKSAAAGDWEDDE